MARSIAGHMDCHICGKRITLSGLARTSHMRAHVRKGEAVEWEVPGEYGQHFSRPGTPLPVNALRRT